MTYSELHEALIAQCSQSEHADNIIGHIMDENECWEWDATVPDADVMAAMI